MGTDHFSHYIPDHFYPINGMLADTRTKRAGYFYKDRKDMDECVAESYWMPNKSERHKKFYSRGNICCRLQS
jgi:hypothetical protein